MKDDDSITHRYGKLETVDAREILARARMMRSEYLARLVRSGFSASFKLGRRAISWLAREHERRVTVRTLMMLDDHMLKDIGLSRSQIHGMVNGVFSSPEAGQSQHRATTLTFAANKTAGNNDKVKQAA